MKASELHTLGGYELREQIARDETGVVTYHARAIGDRREVALRVIDLGSGDPHPAAAHHDAAFLNAARISARFEHDNVVKIFAAGTDQGIAYLAMEYLPGCKCLDAFCRPDMLLPVQEAVRIGMQCAMALDCAHRHGVVHRDIKPRHILITGDGRVKIGHFGLARVDGEDEDDGDDGMRVGSPLYASPEQLTGRPVTSQSDLFALGVVMYEMLTGEHPFIAEVIPTIGHNISHKRHVPIRKLRDDVPLALEKIIDRALKKHPAGRYSTGLDLAADLDLVIDRLELAQDGSEASAQFNRIKSLTFFASFPEAEIREVLNASHWQQFEAGVEIIREGEPGDSFHILVDGEVAVRKGGAHVDVLRTGDCFGEIGFVTRRNRMASIVAISPITVMEIRAAVIDRISLGCQLRFHKAFIDTMAERLLRSMEMSSRSVAGADTASVFSPVQTTTGAHGRGSE